MTIRRNNRNRLATISIGAFFLIVGVAMNAAAQNDGTPKIKIAPKPIKQLEIRSIAPVPDMNIRSQPPLKATVRVEDKKPEPGEEMYRIRIDEVGRLARFDEERNAILVGDNLYPLASDVTFIIGEDQYATMPLTMLDKKVVLRKHPETGLITEIRLYKDVRHLVEKNE